MGKQNLFMTNVLSAYNHHKQNIYKLYMEMSLLKQVNESLQLQGGLHVTLDFKSPTGEGSEGSQFTMEHGQKILITHAQCHVRLSAQGPNSNRAAPCGTADMEDLLSTYCSSYDQ